MPRNGYNCAISQEMFGSGVGIHLRDPTSTGTWRRFTSVQRSHFVKMVLISCQFRAEHIGFRLVRVVDSQL